MNIKFDASKLNYTYSGPDYNEHGKSRVWLFPGNGRIREFVFHYVDYDGDFTTWAIQEGIFRNGEKPIYNVLAKGQVRDEEEAFVQMTEAFDRIYHDIMR